MNKNQLINILKNQLNLSKKDTIKFFDTTFFVIKDILIKGNKLNIKNFGKFCVKEKSERYFYNPQLNTVQLAMPKKVITFKSCKKLI